MVLLFFYAYGVGRGSGSIKMPWRSKTKQVTAVS